MSYRYLLIFIIVFASILLIGCKERSDTEKQLLQAEALIMEKPDSSIVILENIDTSLLERDKNKALYGLLLTMAQDKNWRDPTNDSIINFAVDYFRKKKDNDRLRKAVYYQGRVRFLKGDYSNALISFNVAKELAESENDYFYAGMACRGISDIYFKVSASADELNYSIKEYEFLKKTGIQPYVNYALNDLAYSYNNNGDYKKTIAICNELLDSALLYKDENLYYRALYLKAKSLYWNSRFTESEKLFQEILDSGKGKREDSVYFSLNLLALNKDNELKIIKDQITEKNDLLGSWSSYLYTKKAGNFKEALVYLENMKSLIDEGNKEKRSIDFSSSLSEYMELNHRLDKVEIIKARYKTGFIITVSTFFVALLILIIIIFFKRHKKIVEDKLKLLQELEFMLNKSFIEREKIKSQSWAKINEYVQTHVTVLDNLGNLTGRSINSQIQKNQLVKYVSSLLEEISKEGPGLKKFEDTANELYSDIYNDFKFDFPGLKPQDYHLFLFTVLGFSITSISLFLGEEKISAIYSRKKRLKKKINSLPNNIKEKYLKFM